MNRAELLCRSIEKEARYLNDTRDRGTVRGIIGAAKDEDELVRCYRRIEILFSTLQVGLRTRFADHSSITLLNYG